MVRVRIPDKNIKIEDAKEAAVDLSGIGIIYERLLEIALYPPSKPGYFHLH